MKLTKTRLKQIIKEVLEVHFAPENLTDMDAEEAYGLGYQAKATEIEEKEASSNPTKLKLNFKQ
tara:strand:+ start:118 stop:309 length:192 start_codon:yes stop_codon:yes gene_type:complete